MNLVDLLVLAVIAVSALLGLSRGFVREMLGLGAWVVAGYGAYQLGPSVIPWAEKTIGNPDVADPLAYVGTFILLLIALSLLANLVGRAVRVSALGGLDRTLGLVFGIVRGVALLVAAYIPMAQLLPVEKWPPQVQQARTLPLIYEGADWVAVHLPDKYRPRVAAPPDGPQAHASDLLHATPEGHALGPAPVRN